MLWVQVPPDHEAAHFFLGKVTALGVLCCFALFVCLILLASFFLPSHLSFKNMYMYIHGHQVLSVCKYCNTAFNIHIQNHMYCDIVPVAMQYFTHCCGQKK